MVKIKGIIKFFLSLLKLKPVSGSEMDFVIQDIPERFAFMVISYVMNLYFLTLIDPHTIH
jgi:hypothetical protein